MPLATTFAGLSARALGFGSGAGYVYDNFLRTTSPGVLGNAVTGQAWMNDGGWNCNGSAATGGEPEVPSFIPFKADATITLQDLTNDNGISFWCVDANNFWFSYIQIFYDGSVYETQLYIYQVSGGTLIQQLSTILTTSGSSSMQANSLGVVTSGDDITVTGYVGSNATGTILGSPATASYSGSKGTGVGIIAMAWNGRPPSPISGDTVGPFTAR